MGTKKTKVVVASAVVASYAWFSGSASADPPAPPPGPKTTIDHDGTYRVGADIAAGTYSTAGPVGSGTCYWKRMSGPTGNEVVDNAISKKPQVVEIDPGDKSFKTDGCQPWQITDQDSAGADLPPAGAQAQLHNFLNDLNARAGQAGVPPLPH